MSVFGDATGTGGRGKFVTIALLITIFAATLRALYVATAQIDSPVYGDGLQYLAYAWNLLEQGIFSSSPPGSSVLIPDGYRAPGYPLLLAVALGLAGGGESVDVGIRYAQIAQVAIGTATVLITMALARFWLGRGLALCVGILVACWPHLISFSATIMSETLFGFFLVLALWLLCWGERRSRALILGASGVAFGCAYLVNPLILFFPFAVCMMLFRRGKVQLAAVFVAAALIAPIGWGWRNAQLTTDISQFHHAIDGFVWGSSPTYLPAFNSRWVSPDAKRIVANEQEETRQVLADPVSGISAMLGRMRQEPVAYLSWYLLQKPYLLWDWSIVIGTGDIYYPVTQRSPFDRIAILRWMKQLIQWLNPAVFVLAAGGALHFARREIRQPVDSDFLPAVLAMFFLYLTALHALLTAEPRYSIPYRPEELLMAVISATCIVAACVRRWRRGNSTISDNGSHGQNA